MYMTLPLTKCSTDMKEVGNIAAYWWMLRVARRCLSGSLPLQKVRGFNSMFNREHHQTILHILDCLNPEIFYDVGALFGGGTLITLLYEEYRWSKDVDFICPVGPGCKRLRQIVSDNNFKPSALFARTESLE